MFFSRKILNEEIGLNVLQLDGKFCESFIRPKKTREILEMNDNKNLSSKFKTKSCWLVWWIASQKIIMISIGNLE